ncbi:hypothetical protein [Sorangium sp. So ce406]|uniref:hypothetical protein n=1 Tax=Sorangium sp. So ce406 TaxID=3133311 RepID=UPI003F5B8884
MIGVVDVIGAIGVNDASGVMGAMFPVMSSKFEPLLDPACGELDRGDLRSATDHALRGGAAEKKKAEPAAVLSRGGDRTRRRAVDVDDVDDVECAKGRKIQSCSGPGVLGVLAVS